MATGIAAVAALALGLAAGERFPDIDQRTDMLLHRSALTHGPLLPLLLYALASRTGKTPVRWLAMGICLGVAVHLAFDLFPRGWRGFALVSLPVYGWLPVPVSIGWIAAGSALCLYLGARLARGLPEGALFLAGTAGVFAYAAPGEHALWRPLTFAAAATVLAGGAAALVRLWPASSRSSPHGPMPSGPSSSARS